MAKFVFNLEALLRQREHAEQQCQRVLATRQRALAECDGELARLNETVQKTNDDVRQHHLTGVLDMSFLAAHRRFMFALQRPGPWVAPRIAAGAEKGGEGPGALGGAGQAGEDTGEARGEETEAGGGAPGP